MSSQSMITIVAPLARPRVLPLRQEIDAKFGNPANAVFRAAVENAGAPFLHFASCHALEASDGVAGHLVLEFSADGDETSALAELASRAGELFRPLFAQASDWREPQDLLAYWKAHQVKIGYGLSDTPGLAFCGTPRQGVSCIRDEDELAREIAGLLARQDIAMRPLARIAEVRRHLAESDSLKWAIEPPPPPLAAPRNEPSTAAKVFTLGPALVTTYLWPILIGFLPLAVWLAWPHEGFWTEWPEGEAGGFGHGAFVAKQVVALAAATLGLLLAFVGAVLLAAWFVFSREEARDWLSERSADQAELREMVARENPVGFSQNHMVSHTRLKPGVLRSLTIRLAFFAIARLTTLNPRVGHLGEIGTIHFARWVTIPGTRDFLFFSNYGGSWESYLEDFITKAHAGLTAVWSNTVGFPRTRNLFLDGATDGERFKRYARQSMVHTPFWYSAYPTLTTANIRCNQLIRLGVSAAMTEAEVVEWLTHFGSAPRPIEKLETTQIQSLVFGGMGFKPDGRLLLVKLGEDEARNRQWLREILPGIAFNDGRYATQDALLTFAASRDGLAKLGLDEATLATFPAAFVQGMHAEGRDRILGDLGSNHRDNWSWGRDGNDIALLLYGNLVEDGFARPIDVLEAEIRTRTEAAGGRIEHKVDLAPVAPTLAERTEPFGFVDGVSQPAMRGTYRGLRNDDPIHLVEPGEFVLGYPDNRGNVPPSPTMEPHRDPGLQLPVAGSAHGFTETLAENPRLAGFNGSYLVIRQLEQHVDVFQDFCRQEANRLGGAFPDLPLLSGSQDMADYIAAKMIGRWQDGSSLVRNPYLSASRLKEITGHDAGAAASRPRSSPAQAGAGEISPPDARPEPVAESAVMKQDQSGQRTRQGTRPPSGVRPDNDFLFGTEDPQGVRCPYGAHVRRANPRESLSPGSSDQIDISNRHRIFRVGRGYLSEDGRSTAGLMFMCLNGDIERQFEFVQQTWMGSTKFHGLSAEADPIAGRCLAGGDGFTIATRRGPVGLRRLPQFVTMRGGGYFFLPGRQLLLFLSGEGGPGSLFSPGTGSASMTNRAE